VLANGYIGTDGAWTLLTGEGMATQVCGQWSFWHLQWLVDFAIALIALLPCLLTRTASIVVCPKQMALDSVWPALSQTMSWLLYTHVSYIVDAPVSIEDLFRYVVIQERLAMASSDGVQSCWRKQRLQSLASNPSDVEVRGLLWALSASSWEPLLVVCVAKGTRPLTVHQRQNRMFSTANQ